MISKSAPDNILIRNLDRTSQRPVLKDTITEKA